MKERASAWRFAKKIVENHDGFIFAEGKEQEGAVFHIFSPVLSVS